MRKVRDEDIPFEMPGWMWWLATIPLWVGAVILVIAG